MFRRRRRTEDFSAEIESHLALEADRLVAEGWTPEAARDASRRAFGNVTAARERFYEESRWAWLDQLEQDLRYAWRGLRQSPAFLMTTVATLAIGLGLVTVAFTVFNAYVLRPFAVRDPAGLHQVGWHSRDGGGRQFRWGDYEEIRRRDDLFSAAVAESTRFVSSNGRPLAVALVSSNYFEALGPRVLVGRPLATADEGTQVAVISHQAWTRLFARDPGVTGRPIDINGHAFVIVGVLAPEFTGLSDMPRDLWVPLTTYAAIAQPGLVGGHQSRSVEIVARLARGVTARQAESALASYVAGAIEGQDEVRADVLVHASPNPLSVQMLAVLSPVFGAFVLVLVTACANVSNVMLARAITRNREIAVRLSLGASRGRVVRQLLTEGLLISVLAGLTGLALAAWLLKAAMVVFFSTLPPSVAAILRAAPMDIDHRVFLFALAVAAATTLMFALVPALQASRLRLTDALRGQGGDVRRGSRLRSALVVAQVAVSVVLTVVALTLARGGAAVGSIDPGYDTAGVLSINVREEEQGLVPRLAAVLSADPRVAEVASTGGNPLFVRSRSVAAAPEGASVAVGTRYTFVSPEYFSLLKIPFVHGRGFRDDEARGSARVAVISAATAAAFWPGEDPIGRTIRIEPPEGRPVEALPGYARVTVVGTVGDVVSGLVIDGKDPGHIYLPTSAESANAIALLARGRGELGPETLQQLFRQAAADPQVFEALPLDEMRQLQIYPLLAASWVGSLLGLVALALSVSGLYGVLTYTLSQRTREIGIRMALGATTGAVVRLVLRQSARLAGVGAAAGVVIAFGAMAALRSVIEFRTITIVDLAAFVLAVAIVGSATALAAYYPARRATRIAPSETLRADA